MAKKATKAAKNGIGRLGCSQTRATTQSCLDKTKISPSAGQRYQCTNLTQFKGTQEKEVKALRRLLPKDGSN